MAAVAVLDINMEKIPVMSMKPKSTFSERLPKGAMSVLAMSTSRRLLVAAMAMMKPPKKRMIVGSAKHAMIPWYSSRSPYSPSEPCMMLKAELDAPNSNTKMMTTEVAHAGMASVSHNITAITKMAMMRCCTTVRPSMPKQSIGRFHTKTVSRAVMRNMSPFLRLKSPVNAFFTVSFMFIVESLCFLWTSTMYF